MTNDETTTGKESVTHQVTKDNTIWLSNQQLFGNNPSHNIIKGSIDKVILPPGKITDSSTGYPLGGLSYFLVKSME
jgi:hypothetical protein